MVWGADLAWGLQARFTVFTPQLHRQTLHVLEHTLARGPWSEGAYDLRGRRVGGALLRALLRGLQTEGAMTAVGSALEAARDESPTTSAAWVEAWSRVTLVWCVRETLRAAHEERDSALRVALVHHAAQIAAASARLTQLAPTATDGFESLIETSRDAFSLARDATDRTLVGHDVLQHLLQQLRHMASLLVVGGHSVDHLLRGAIARTDRAARREDLTSWTTAPLARRQALVQHGLLEAAWALAAYVPSLASKGAETAESALWFARTACQLAARVERAADWVPTIPEDSARALPPTEALLSSHISSNNQSTSKSARTDQAAQPTPTKPERAMDSNKLTPVLKTLENDAGDAAWRLAGSQFVKLAKEPLVAVLSRQLSPDDESFRARLATFLDTEMGSAILSSLLSVGLSALPLPNADMTQRLSRELRVRAMAGAGDVLADVLMGPLREVASLYLQGVPTSSTAPNSSAEPVALPATQVIDALRAAAAGTANPIPTEST